jgi:hypothetical protein
MAERGGQGGPTVAGRASWHRAGPPPRLQAAPTPPAPFTAPALPSSSAPARVKSHHSRGPAYDHILKKNEQCYALAALATALCPAAARLLDEGVANALREK